ncbi:phosphoribosyltransferase [Qipengyuania flava]|uniref:phosphoribosyltransferase n=1 Tax=Qipengyuania flava TaxID=192812 RepID=UPI0018E05BCD|nr:phosphoribosyltransferase [Qipengyuania flava]
MELLDKFRYLDGDSYSEAIRSLAHHISITLSLAPDRTAISAREVSAYSDSSQMVAYHLKAIGGLPPEWTTNKFVSGLKEIGEMDIDEVVLVDEFLGTGESMEKSVAYVRELGAANGRNFRIHCAVIAGMDFGLSRLQETADSVYAEYSLKKGISGEYPTELVSEKIAIMDRLESQLSQSSSRGKLSRHNLGYKKSEALYSRHEGNTPNNVFPIFWWEKTRKGEGRDKLLICR